MYLSFNTKAFKTNRKPENRLKAKSLVIKKYDYNKSELNSEMIAKRCEASILPYDYCLRVNQQKQHIL